MFKKFSLFLFVLTILQVSARYENVEPDRIENKHSLISTEASSSASRIVSGWEAQPGQHPHHADLRMVNNFGTVFRCGGSIIAKEWVISSAACIANRIFIVVRAGLVSILNPEYVFETSKVYTHPLFNVAGPARQTNNIGLVKLERPFTYTRLLKPIRIQSSADAYRNYENQQVYTSGTGSTWSNGIPSDVLRWVYLRVISNSDCMRTYTGNIIVNTTICAQYYNVTTQSTCNNDNGGPLVHVGSEGVPTLIGVTSFVNTANCHSGLPIAFTRPGPYLTWLEEVTGIDFENLQEDSDEDTDSSEPNEDDDMVQLMKRLEVNVNVKVAINKYNVTKAVGQDVSVIKH